MGLYAFRNLLMFLRSQIRKFWWNLGSHLTLLACASALCALFLYIFRDFVILQLAALDPTWSQRGITAVLIVLGMIFGILSGQWSVHSIYGEDSLIAMMSRVGVSKKDQELYKLQILVLSILGATLAAASAAWFLYPPLAPFCAIIALAVSTLRVSRGKTNTPCDTVEVLDIPDWRRHQLLHRSMPGRGLLILSMLASFLLPVAAIAKPHVFLLQVAALACGLTATFGLISAIAAELPGCWFEKQAGLTHDAWIKSWQHIANAVSVVLALSGGVAILLQPPEVRAFDWALPAIAACLPWLTPSLILQIEGRAKNVNMMVAVLIALFLGTAMIATPWAVAALPLLKTQAKIYQQGRFYRA